MKTARFYSDINIFSFFIMTAHLSIYEGIMGVNDLNQLESALTSCCMQYGWGVRYYYHCCPKKITATPLDDYFLRLKVGAIFAYYDNTPKLIAIKFVKIKNNSSILVLCEREGDWCERLGFFPWVICEVTLESGFFTHYKIEEFFEKDEAEQAFCTKQGRHEVTEVF